MQLRQIFFDSTQSEVLKSKKQIISALSHTQRTVKSDHWVSALFTWTSVNKKSKLTDEYFLINWTISSDSTQVNTKALIDTDNSDYAFID